MPSTPTVVFDVNETLSDLRPLAGAFEAVGLPAATADLWFARVLRDGFALTAAGATARFADIGASVFVELATMHGGVPDPADAAAHVLRSFLDLPVHPDVVEGVGALAGAGVRLVTLSNGSADVAERLLARAGIRDAFAHVLSVDDAGVWKPAPGAYAHAARVCEAALADMTMVAVHPWDVDGAGRAGMQTAWLARADVAFPAYLRLPDIQAQTITELVAALF